MKIELGFFEILTLILITLKLTNVIDISWWIVWSPFYGSALVSAVITVYQEEKSSKQRNDK